ncbi:MAG: YtxH domain-containing protein [Anaerolineae bacterium]
MSKEGGGDFAAGFLVGALVGAAVALVLAPVSGEEMRNQLREKSIELKDKAEDLGLDAGKTVETVRAKGQALLDEQKTRFQEAIDEGRLAAQRKKEELLSQLEAARSTEKPVDLTGNQA